MDQPLITILTAPKPFVDPNLQIIQKNALRSWKALGNLIDVIVLGNEKGIKENCRSLGIKHFPEVRCNDSGTPLISSMLEIGRNESKSPYLAIVNSDIILFPDFVQAVKDVSKVERRFLIIGQRWNMDIFEEIGEHESDFTLLKAQIQNEARLHPPMGSDYCIFLRTCYRSIPDFAIGRAGWDNWFIYKSRWEGWAIVDGTHDVIIVHQSHDYAHLPEGKPHYRLPETKRNIILGGGEHTIFTLCDAQYDLMNGELIKKRYSLEKVIREIEIFPLTKKRSLFLGKLFFYVFHPNKGYAAIRKSVKSR